MNDSTRKIICFCIVLLASLTTCFAGTIKETVADLQAAANEGLPDVQDLKQGLTEVNTFLNGLKSDTTLANNFLTALKKGDRTALATVVKSRVSQSVVTVDKLDLTNSFTTLITFETRRGRKITVCLSNEAVSLCTGGKSVSITRSTQ